MISPFIALQQATRQRNLAQFLQPVTYATHYQPSVTQTLYAEITIHENVGPQGDHKGQFIPMKATLNIGQGAFQVQDTFTFPNPATGISLTWKLVGAPQQRLDGSMDLMVEQVLDVEKAGEGYRGRR